MANAKTREDINNEINKIGNKLQSSLNISKGPMIQIGIINIGSSEQRLLIVIHHLVIDGVSWRILLEDLMIAYNGETLPPKTISYGRWAKALQEYADSEALEKQEIEYWINQPSAPSLPLVHTMMPKKAMQRR